MKKTIALSLTALLLGTAAAATAADGEKKKCAVEATVCVREMAEGLKQRGWIGIEWDDQSEPPRITHVVRSSPAEKAGIRVGDVVKAFGGVSVSEEDEVLWAAMKRSLVPGKVMTVDVERDGTAKAIDVELIPVPDHIIAQWVGKHVLEHHKAAPEDQVAAKP